MLSAIYGKVMSLRNALYDRGTFEAHDLGARTISVGNITTGGTGKTPLVAKIAEMLGGRSEKVCILTRGYGRKDPKKRVLVSNGDQVLADAATGGDEPVELANKLDVADKTIKRDIAKLKEQNRLIRVGSLKSGHWEIKE